MRSATVWSTSRSMGSPTIVVPSDDGRTTTRQSPSPVPLTVIGVPVAGLAGTSGLSPVSSTDSTTEPDADRSST